MLNVNYAFLCGDLPYHTAFLVLSCTSAATHWSSEDWKTIRMVDRVVAHACYGLCAWTHFVTHPNAPGAVCLVIGLLLWVTEFYQRDWRPTHCALHTVGFIGAHLAISQRSKSL